MIHTLDQVLTYQIDQIVVVVPSDLGALEIDPEKDYCTLITCTPYGVNSHRLMLRGVRVETIAEQSAQEQPTVTEQTPYDATAGLIAIAILVLVLMLLIRSVCRKKDAKEAQKQPANTTRKA